MHITSMVRLIILAMCLCGTPFARAAGGKADKFFDPPLAPYGPTDTVRARYKSSDRQGGAFLEFVVFFREPVVIAGFAAASIRSLVFVKCGGHGDSSWRQTSVESLTALDGAGKPAATKDRQKVTQALTKWMTKALGEGDSCALPDQLKKSSRVPLPAFVTPKPGAAQPTIPVAQNEPVKPRDFREPGELCNIFGVNREFQTKTLYKDAEREHRRSNTAKPHSVMGYPLIRVETEQEKKAYSVGWIVRGSFSKAKDDFARSFKFKRSEIVVDNNPEAQLFEEAPDQVVTFNVRFALRSPDAKPKYGTLSIVKPIANVPRFVVACQVEAS
jgi:hypothetical protein